MLSESRPEVKSGEYWANMAEVSKGGVNDVNRVDEDWDSPMSTRTSRTTGRGGTRGRWGEARFYYMVLSTRRGRFCFRGRLWLHVSAHRR